MNKFIGIIIGILFFSQGTLAETWCSYGQNINNPISSTIQLCVNHSEERGAIDKILLKNIYDKKEVDLKGILDDYSLSELRSVFLETASITLTFGGQKKGKGNRYGLVKIIFDRVGNYKVIALPSR